MSKTSSSLNKKIGAIILVLAVAALAWWGWLNFSDSGYGDGFVSGNGRIEATEIDVATKLPGRVSEILVREGDFVQEGQVVARMQLDTLQAQHDEAFAGQERAEHGVAVAQAQIALRQSDLAAVQAMIVQREAELDAAKRRLARSETLAKEGASSAQELDDDRARVRVGEAALKATRAQAASAKSAVQAAEAQLVGSQSGVQAARASVSRIQADIDDSALKAPRNGRVQFRVAQAGEVLGAGGRVLNLLDLSDVYMTFFIPETVAGRIALGSEVRLILDAAPQYVIPATISFVASQAQFTPKTVETASERQKLMFRVRAQIPEDLLKKHLEQVKTGVPGTAWVKLSADESWPAELQANVTVE